MRVVPLCGGSHASLRVLWRGLSSRGLTHFLFTRALLFSPAPPRAPNPLRFRILIGTSGNANGVAPTSDNLQRFMRQLLALVQEHGDSWPFHDPVDAAEVPDYYDVIKNPVSLVLIGQRLQSQQYYLTLEMFAADFRTMFSNARKYNAQDTEYYKCANRLVRGASIGWP